MTNLNFTLKKQPTHKKQKQKKATVYCAYDHPTDYYLLWNVWIH